MFVKAKLLVPFHPSLLLGFNFLRRKNDTVRKRARTATTNILNIFHFESSKTQDGNSIRVLSSRKVIIFLNKKIIVSSQVLL